MARGRARLITEIVTSQLADQLQIEVFKLTARPSFVADAKLHGETEDAANSVCRHVAEGLDCTSPGKSVQYLEFSGRSLKALLDSLRVARVKQYLSLSDLTAISALTKHLDAALGHLMVVTDRGATRSRRAGVRRRASPTSP
jgi:four helix bundle protein